MKKTFKEKYKNKDFQEREKYLLKIIKSKCKDCCENSSLEMKLWNVTQCSLFDVKEYLLKF